MCILTFVTRYCERFPFILIGNRDEQLGRGTRHLRHDAQSGLLWAIDELAGGSWMGIEPHSGRFTILTNCRRAPAAPLTRTTDNPNSNSSSSSGSSSGSSTKTGATTASSDKEESRESVDWRGAAPLAHIRQYTHVVAVRPDLASTEHPHGVTLRYEPPSSRGTVVKNFLVDGSLPPSTGSGTATSSPPPHSPLREPYYAGYNLLSCDTLRTPTPAVRYTTNRYGAQHNCPVSAGEVHVLQNSFLDNTAGEPISARLRQLFEAALQEVVTPFAENASMPCDVADVATRLADACLCDRSNVDIADMMAAGEGKEGTVAAAAAAVRATVQSTNPLLGFSTSELQSFFGETGGAGVDVASPLDFTDGGAARVETHLQANILKVPVGGHGTRVQSMVLVERVPTMKDGAATKDTAVLYFCQRDVSFAGPQQACVAAPWIVFSIDADGTTTRVDG